MKILYSINAEPELLFRSRCSCGGEVIVLEQCVLCASCKRLPIKCECHFYLEDPYSLGYKQGYKNKGYNNPYPNKSVEKIQFANGYSDGAFELSSGRI